MSDVPAVEMLWESADPHEELTKRFGFDDGAATASWVADVLGRWWELDVVHCHRLVMSGRNVMAWVETDDRSVIAKWSSLPNRFSRLEASARVVSWLDALDVPVAAPIPARDGRLLIELANETMGTMRSRLPLPGSRFLVGVLPVVEGELLTVDDATQVEDAGRMLATIHRALVKCPWSQDRRGRRAGRQLVHNDFRSANVLHDGTGITAVLDFEEITHATRAGDIAKSAVLLATRYRDWGPTSAEVRAAYLDAYCDQALDPLTAAERRDIDRRVATVLKHFGWT